MNICLILGMNELTTDLNAAEEQCGNLTKKIETIIGICNPTNQNFENDDEIAENSSNDEDENLQLTKWQQEGRHVFILSTSGKPIYTRHGSEEKLVTLFGVMQALVSTFQDEQDEIRSIHCEDSHFAFLRKEHLILMLVSRVQYEHIEECHQQLNYVFNQILSTLTLSQLARVFEQHNNFDLRRLLAGSERLIDSMISFTENEPSFFLSGVECLPLNFSVRESIVNAISSSCSKLKNLLFAVLITENQLISMIRLKKYDLQPPDLHIIFNLVSSSPSFKSAESWSPLCLPNFDSSGFLQIHVSYLSDDCPVCLLLVAVDRDMFYLLSEAKNNILEKLTKNNSITPINEALNQRKVMTSEFGVTGLRHFVYKDKSNHQFLYPAYEAPYITQELQLDLFRRYKNMNYKLKSETCPLRLIYEKKDVEILLAWDTKSFQLFMAMEPFISKSEAIGMIDKLLKAIKKKEDRFFIMNCPTF